MEQLQYKAFISYRHVSPDQEIAKKLHTYIETYGIPASLKKSLGISKMGRVFRDQDELPLSSNLGDDIHRALDSSEWLICICSPRYLQSKWCLEEVNYFLASGRRDHILTVLTEGEPADSFPEQLRFEEIDGKRIEIEPLAADVRSDTLEGSLKKLNAEKLRILAPMLGVNFDDLKQRAKQRRNRLLAASAAAVIAVLAGFLGYAVVKNGQITAQRNDALISQSKFLANEADELLENGGDRMLAMLLAKEALPEDFEKPDRPVTDEAVCALRSALASGISDNYETVADFDFAVKGFQANGKSLVVCSDGVPGYLAAYLLENGEQKEYPYSLTKSPFQAVFSKDLLSFYYVDDSGIGHARSLGSKYIQGNVVDYTYFKNYDNPIAVDEDCDKYVYTQGYTVYTAEGVQKEGDVSVSHPVIFPNEAFNTNLQYTGMYLTQVLTREIGDVSLMLMGEGTFQDNVLYHYYVENVNEDGAHVYGGTGYEDFVIDYAPSFDGNHIVALTYGGVYVWNTFTQQQVAAVSFQAFDGSRLKSMQVSSANSRVAVTTEGRNLFLYDFSTGEVTPVNLGGYLADTMHFSEDGSMLLCCDTDQDTALVIASGEVWQKVPVDFELTDVCYAGHDTRGNSSDDRYIMLTGEKKTRLMKAGGNRSEGMVFQPEGGVAKPEEAVISADGSKIWYYSSAILADTGTRRYYLNVRDLETKENTIVEEYDTLSLAYCYDLHRAGGRFIARSGCEGYNEPSKIVLYDSGTFEQIDTLHPSGKGKDEDGYALESGTEQLNCLYSDERYAVFGASPCYYVFDAETMDLLFTDVRQYGYWERTFSFEGDYMLMYGVRNAAHGAQVVNTQTWEEEGCVIDFPCDVFCGFLCDAHVPGFSDLLAVYLYNTRTHVLDLRSGEEQILDLDGSQKAALTEAGIVIRTENTGSYLYDGTDLTPCEEPDGLFNDENREFLFRDEWAYQDEGVIYRSADGERLLDFKNRSVTVTGSCENGSRLLFIREEDGPFVLNCLSAQEMLALARDLLGERELTKEQRERYFLE